MLTDDRSRRLIEKRKRKKEKRRKWKNKREKRNRLMEGVNMEGANKRGAHANGGGRRGARVRPFVPRINERSHSICYLRGLLNGRSAARGWRDIDARGNERPSFFLLLLLLASVSNVRSKGREASSFPGCDKRSNINSGTKAGGRGLYWIAVVMPKIARSPWPERVVPGEERGVMCLSCARIYCSCCF